MTTPMKPSLVALMAKNVRKRLIDLDWTQAQLAERLNVTQSTVSLWCTGKRPIDIYRLEEVARALDCTPESLMARPS